MFDMFETHVEEWPMYVLHFEFSSLSINMSSALRKLIPLGNRVLIKKVEPVLKTAGGIYLPDSGKNSQTEGEVVAVGPGARNHEGSLIPLGVSVGDKVLLPEYGGSVLKLGEDEFHLYRDEEILGKFH
ncbi:hypothetical protein DYB28_009288 [Aphanomyces astaci]|uniref:10 kDa chaperonin n=1 Tax=Aphanomyces astaci TaxID=112090 RepID=A0A9X8E7Z2_APHAT|nr:hypothetical protein DYB28_009288 [Aphanomyces astaci]